MQHLPQLNLRAFASGALPPAAMIAADEHLAECETCRLALASEIGADRMLAQISKDFEAQSTRHLTYEETRLLAEAKLVSVDARKHASHCSQCAMDVADLRQFAGTFVAAPIIQTRASSRSWRYEWMAAALLLGALGLSMYSFRKPPAQQATASHSTGLPTPSPAAQSAKLPAELQALVAQAAASGRLPGPLFDRSAGQIETLLGTAPTPAPFMLLEPSGIVVTQDQPVFTWQAWRKATSYKVAIFDAEYRKVAESDSLRTTAWQVPKPLRRNVAYTWTVTAVGSGRSIRVPVPPQPEARFTVMDGGRADKLAQLRGDYPDNHLLLAAAYAQYGDVPSANDQLNLLAGSGASPQLVRSLRASLPNVLPANK